MRFNRRFSARSSGVSASCQASGGTILLLRSAVALLKRLSTAQGIGLMAAAIFYVVAGTLHFIKPAVYLKIMPPYIPWHSAMVRSACSMEVGTLSDADDLRSF